MEPKDIVLITFDFHCTSLIPTSIYIVNLSYADSVMPARALIACKLKCGLLNLTELL